MTSIPENQPLSDSIKILRPLNDVKSDQINYHQIIKVFSVAKASKETKQVKSSKKKVNQRDAESSYNVK